MAVLIVNLNQELITQGLANLGHTFLIATSVEAALNLLEEKDIDLIIAPSSFIAQCPVADKNLLRHIPVLSTSGLMPRVQTVTNHAAVFVH